MQLPRGTFRSIQKGVNFREFLAEMVSSRFTGTCTISSVILNGTLVFRSGTCVLAKVQDQYGDRGWEEVMAVPDLVTDLALSDFNTAQIQLALDFNKKARVTMPMAPVFAKTDHPVQSGKSISREPVRAPSPIRREQKKRESPVVSSARETAGTAGILSPTPKDVREEVPETAPEPAPEPARQEEGQRAEGSKEAVPEDLPRKPDKTPGSLEESDLDMFDSMDLDDVALKIRKDCKIILKQLQLDHLTEK
ncbi:MAG TPA: hypothetical protein PKZ65_00890 [Methanoregulaceae archaeon]|nr:hypothetical protein [Methanoregulaceae archaeon]